MKAVFEKVDAQDESSIVAFQYSNENFDAPWHFHPEYELTYIVESSGTRYVGNNISSYEKGDLVLLGPNLPHCWKNDPNSEEAAKSLVIQWPKELLHQMPAFRSIETLLKTSQRGILFSDFNTSELVSKIENIIQANSVHRLVHLLELLDTLTKHENIETLAGSSYKFDLSNDTNSRIQKVQQYVNEHYQSKIRLKEVADELHMTEQSFSRFFSRVMKRPFFIFLNEYRVNRASRLLVETELQVNEIGYQCGYDSLPFFYQQFKKFKGYSPLAFRKMYRKMDS